MKPKSLHPLAAALAAASLTEDIALGYDNWIADMAVQRALYLRLRGVKNPDKVTAVIQACCLKYSRMFQHVDLKSVPGLVRRCSTQDTMTAHGLKKLITRLAQRAASSYDTD